LAALRPDTEIGLQGSRAAQSSAEDIYRLLDDEADAVVRIGCHAAQPQLQAINPRFDIIGPGQRKIPHLPGQQS